MTELTRRTVLTGAAAAGAAALAPALPSPAQAAAPLAGTAGGRAGIATRSASIEVTVATDGVNRFKLPGRLRHQSRAASEMNAGAGSRLSAAWTRT